jgi:hypothetical protein
MSDGLVTAAEAAAAAEGVCVWGGIRRMWGNDKATVMQRRFCNELLHVCRRLRRPGRQSSGTAVTQHSSVDGGDGRHRRRGGDVETRMQSGVWGRELEVSDQ